MTTSSIDTGQPADSAGFENRFLDRLDDVLVRLGEMTNPILVKETRQALKSRQFTVTFVLLLVTAWCWSFLGTAIQYPQIRYSADGPDMFIGYFFILAFPLLVVVPFGAFRSISSEREDRTYDLMSITTLSPRQIISGKLASAMIQMLIYLSALSPCLAFTYLLRGLDFVTIFLVIVYTVAASLAFSLIAILLGTLSTNRHWQTLLSVAIIAGLGAAFFMACGLAMGIVQQNVLPVGITGFWQANAFGLTVYGTYFAVLFTAAAAQLSFASANRSTPVRVALVVQQGLLVGWATWLWFLMGREDPSVEFLQLISVLWMIHWLAVGSFLVGESGEMSPRVRRGLPQTGLGRTLFTWFNPGPTTGYVFAVTCFATFHLFVFTGVMLAEMGWMGFAYGRLGVNELESTALFSLYTWCYVTIFLGATRQFTRAISRFAAHVPFIGPVVLGVLVAMGIFVPITVQFLLAWDQFMDYSWMQVTNLAWTLEHTFDNMPRETGFLMFALPLGAVVMLMVNLPSLFRELNYVRVAKPARLLEEDAARARRTVREEPVRTSPWDDGRRSELPRRDSADGDA